MTSPSVVDNGTVNDTALPPAAVCFHLATLYFDYVHDQLHTLFQKPAFMADMVMNKTPPVIMYAVIALSARLVKLTRVRNEHQHKSDRRLDVQVLIP